MKIKFSSQIKEKLREIGVDIVYLIGSRASATERNNSDFDFAVLMNGNQYIRNYSTLYNNLYAIFSDAVLDHFRTGKSLYSKDIYAIDIVFLNKAPLYYSIAARDHGKALFFSTPQLMANFEEKITLQYADFAYFRKEQESVTLSMI